MSVQFVFIDAGQGDCTMIVLPDKRCILVDCGCMKNTKVVDTQILEVLKTFVAASPDKNLKALVVTHPDKDHYNRIIPLLINNKITFNTLHVGAKIDHYSIGGLNSWIKNTWKPAWIKRTKEADPDEYMGYDPVPEIELGKDTYDKSFRGTLSYANDDNEIVVDIRILAANVGGTADPNQSSIVLFVRYDGINVFLMGDSTAKCEEHVMANAKDTDIEKWVKTGPNVLKLGHHGSKTSSSQAWIDWLKPKVIFVSSDTKTFGKDGPSLPSSDVMDRYLASGYLGSDFGLDHYFVQYNEALKEHQNAPYDAKNKTSSATKLQVYSTLHFLKFDANDATKFTGYGTSWHYTLNGNNTVTLVSTLKTEEQLTKGY